MSKKNLLSMGLIGGAILLLFLLVSTRPEAHVEAVEESRFAVQTLSIEPQPLHPELALIARVDSAAQPTLTAAVSAEVLAVPAREGQTVEAGAILVELDDRDAQVQLRQAQAELAQAESSRQLQQEQNRADAENLQREQELARLSENELARLIRLRTQGLVSETSVDQAKQNHQRNLLSLAAREQAVRRASANAAQADARVSAAEAALQAAELQLERTLVRAPFPAAVTRVLVEAGARVSPGQSLLALYDTGNLEFVAELPTRYLAPLQQDLDKGKPAEGHVRFGEQSFRVRLLRLGKEASGGAVQAWMGLAEPGLLPVGIQLPLRLELPTVPAAVAMPESGLYDLSKVFRIVDGRLESMSVRVHGTLDEGRRVVISHPDLKAGDHLLVTHLANAVTGLAVRELSQ